MTEDDDHFRPVHCDTVSMDPQMYTHGHILMSIPSSKQNELGMPAMPALRRWRQNGQEFKTSLCFTVKACPNKKDKN